MEQLANLAEWFCFSSSVVKKIWQRTKASWVNVSEACMTRFCDLKLVWSDHSMDISKKGAKTMTDGGFWETLSDKRSHFVTVLNHILIPSYRNICFRYYYLASTNRKHLKHSYFLESFNFRHYQILQLVVTIWKVSI